MQPIAQQTSPSLTRELFEAKTRKSKGVPGSAQSVALLDKEFQYPHFFSRWLLLLELRLSLLPNLVAFFFPLILFDFCFIYFLIFDFTRKYIFLILFFS